MNTFLGKVPDMAREVRLAAHLTGALTLGNFEVVEVAMPGLGDGEVLVRTDYLHLAAAYQDLMRADCNLPMPPFQVGQRLGGGMVGTVVRSRSADLAMGDLVHSFAGWCEYSAGPADAYIKLDRDVFPSPVYYLSQGPTAYYGMAEIAQVGPGDVVFVSGAAGGVGSLAGQIAKNLGAEKVIGSAGTKAKVDFLVKELGFDAAFNYHDRPVVDQLSELAPGGISVVFDNVGGEQFEAAVQVASSGARFALCGALASQNGDGRDGFPRLDTLTAITKGLQLRPFATYHTPEQIAAWYQHFGMWLGAGRFVFPHTTVEGGIGYAPQALVSMLAGQYQGNVAVQIAA